VRKCRTGERMREKIWKVSHGRETNVTRRRQRLGKKNESTRKIQLTLSEGRARAEIRRGGSGEYCMHHTVTEGVCDASARIGCLLRIAIEVSGMTHLCGAGECSK